MSKKVIIVIGSNGLIGKYLCNYLLNNNNNNVVMVDFKKTNIKSKNTNGLFIKSDITKENSIKKIILSVYKKYKKIDVVINCAYPKTKKWGKSFINSNPNDIKEDLFNQLGSSILICRNFYKFFAKQGYGNLILLSSIQSLKSPIFEHYKGTNITSPIEYSAIKSGINSIVKYMAKYSKNKNIRFNSISPGGIFNNQPKKF